jgi:hypothetical protein
VAFEVENLRAEITMCHCSQCRRLSGHHWAATRAILDEVVFTNQVGLTWFASSDWAKSGFCNRCGSSLLYRMNDEDGIGIAAGAFDNPTGFVAGKHIFTADKGDFYTIADDAPHIAKY